MKKIFLIFIALTISSLFIISCSQGENGGIEGPEGSGSEQGESGKRWGIGQTADETINGIHAIITYNTATNVFEGTFENLNSNVAQQTRLEVHVFDAGGKSIEFGPTSPVNMQPGTTRNISLPISVGSYVEFTMHPEVAAAGSGG